MYLLYLSNYLWSTEAIQCFHLAWSIPAGIHLLLHFFFIVCLLLLSLANKNMLMRWVTVSMGMQWCTKWGLFAPGMGMRQTIGVWKENIFFVLWINFFLLRCCFDNVCKSYASMASSVLSDFILLSICLQLLQHIKPRGCCESCLCGPLEAPCKSLMSGMVLDVC